MVDEKIFDSNQSSLYELLDENSHYSIPRHQRAYSWESDQIIQFLEDIFDVHKRQTESNALHEYFFGPMVFYAKKTTDRIKHFEVLDGQQRLATTCMFVAIIRDLLDKFGQTDDATDFHNRLYQKERPYRPEFWRITLGKKNEDYFNNLVLKREDPVTKISKHKPDRYNEDLEFAYKTIFNRLQQELEKIGDKGTFLIELCENFLWSFKVIKIEVGSAANAYKIFETLNAEGLELTITDLLRNHILSESQRDEEDKIADKFDNILENVENTAMDAYLRVHWLAHHEERPRKEELYKVISEEKKGKENVSEYVDSLIEFSKIYHGLMKPYGEDDVWWNDLAIMRTLDYLKSLGSTVCYPVLLIGRKKYDKKDFKELAENCLIWFFRSRTVAQTNASALEKFMVEVATKIRKENASVNEIRSVLTKDVTNPDDKKFKSLFTELSIKSPQIQKYILLQIEKFASGVKDLEPIDKITVEHVLPRNLPEHSKWKKIFDDVDHKRLLHRLGNLTLLRKEENSSAQDADFEKKKTAAFSLSSISITKELTQDQVSWNKDETTQPDSIKIWNEETIIRRQKAFAEYAVKIWAFD